MLKGATDTSKHCVKQSHGQTNELEIDANSNMRNLITSMP